MPPILAMRRDGQPVIGVGKHVLGIVQGCVGKETRARHRGLILNQPVALVADHPVPVPEKIPERDVLVGRPAPQRLEIALPVHAGSFTNKGCKIRNLTCDDGVRCRGPERIVGWIRGRFGHDRDDNSHHSGRASCTIFVKPRAGNRSSPALRGRNLISSHDPQGLDLSEGKLCH